MLKEIHMKELFEKIKQNRESLLTKSPNSLSQELKTNNTRCNSKPVALLKGKILYPIILINKNR